MNGTAEELEQPEQVENRNKINPIFQSTCTEVNHATCVPTVKMVILFHLDSLHSSCQPAEFRHWYLHLFGCQLTVNSN